MAIRWILATVHLVALGIGLGSVWARGRGLRGALDLAGIRRVLYADTWWGFAALLWISTGLIRAFSTLEKGSAYYLANHMFWAKMSVLLVILALEIWPMIALVRWRIALGRGVVPDTSAAWAFARISAIQAMLVLLMVAAATAMARGYGVAP